ncbi:TPA: hypothetical protein ACNRPM_004122 [Klebsiella pneumoniae]
MSFTFSKQYAVVKNYPDLGILKQSPPEEISVTYKAIVVNSVAAGTAEVQFSVDAGDIGEGIITFVFAPSGFDGLLGQAEEALRQKLVEQL